MVHFESNPGTLEDRDGNFYQNLEVIHVKNDDKLEEAIGRLRWWYIHCRSQREPKVPVMELWIPKGVVR